MSTLPSKEMDKAVEELSHDLHISFTPSESELIRLLVEEWFLQHPCDYKNIHHEIEDSLALLSDYLVESHKGIKQKKKLENAEWLRFEILKRRISRLSSSAFQLEKDAKIIPSDQYNHKQQDLQHFVRDILNFAQATSEQIFEFIRTEVKQTISGHVLIFGLEPLSI